MAGGAEILTGRNESAHGEGDATSWALAGGTVWSFDCEVAERLPRARDEPDESRSWLESIPEQEVEGLAGHCGG